MIRAILLVFMIFISNITLATGTAYVDGKVTKVVAFPQSYGDYSESARGLLGTCVEGLPVGCGSGTARVLISVDHLLHDSALAVALTAHSAGKSVRIAYFESCTLRSDSWDFAYLTLNGN